MSSDNNKSVSLGTSSTSLVTLQPIIKTNIAQARALDVQMINEEEEVNAGRREKKGEQISSTFPLPLPPITTRQIVLNRRPTTTAITNSNESIENLTNSAATPVIELPSSSTPETTSLQRIEPVKDRCSLDGEKKPLLPDSNRLLPTSSISTLVTQTESEQFTSPSNSAATATSPYPLQSPISADSQLSPSKDNILPGINESPPSTSSDHSIPIKSNQFSDPSLSTPFITGANSGGMSKRVTHQTVRSGLVGSFSSWFSHPSSEEKKKKKKTKKPNRFKQSTVSFSKDRGCTDLIQCSPFRLSFRLTLVILCIVEVVIACVMVWYLGYTNSQSLIGTLSSNLRESALAEISNEVVNQMRRTVRAVSSLEYATSRSFPDIGNQTDIRNRTGLLADLSFVAMDFPDISACGIMARSNVFLSAVNISAYLGAGLGPQIPQTTGFAYGVMPIAWNYTANFYFQPPNPYQNPDLPEPDFGPDSLLSDVGPYWYSNTNFVVADKIQFKAGVEANGTYSWTPVYIMSTSYKGIGAVKGYVSSDGSVEWVTFASIFLNRFGDLLRSMSIAYGPNGFAIIVDSMGELIASTNEDHILAAGSSYIPTASSSDLNTVARILLEHGLLAGHPATSVAGEFVSGGTFNLFPPSFDATAVRFNGSDYHLQATVLDAVGLNWIVVVVTKDSDFDDNLTYHSIITGVLSAVVLIVAIVVMILLTQCLNRPLTLILRYMTLVARMGNIQKAGQTNNNPNNNEAMPHSAAHLPELKRIYSAYHNDMNLSLVEEDISSTSPSTGFFETSASEQTKEQNNINTIDRASTSKEIGSKKQSESNADGLETKENSLISLGYRSWWTRLLDRAAVIMMKEVEDMQFTFHSMLYQLTKSTQQLEDANQQKRHFIRYIFHEVRVPLNAVMLGLADLRQSSKGNHVEWSDEQRDVLDIVHEQSQVVGRILNDVLSLHKIEDGALQLQFAPFSLESMILSTMQSFMPGITDKHIHYTAQMQTLSNYVWGDELIAAYGDRLPRIDVIGDKYRLRQVLANFLSNAIKFTATNGNVHISLVIEGISTPSVTSASIQNGNESTPATNEVGTHAERVNSIGGSLTGVNHSYKETQSDPPPGNSPSLRNHRINIEGKNQNDSGFPANQLLPINIRNRTDGANSDASTAPLFEWPLRLPNEAIFRITVRDTGVGVSPANQAKLFSPYMQILPGELQKGAGTGLGLSISLNLIRLHGGKIGHSTPTDGIGSEFFMELPLKMQIRPPQQSSDSANASRVGTDREEQKDGDGIVEDEVDLDVFGQLPPHSAVDDDEADDEAAVRAIEAVEEVINMNDLAQSTGASEANSRAATNPLISSQVLQSLRSAFTDVRYHSNAQLVLSRLHNLQHDDNTTPPVMISGRRIALGNTAANATGSGNASSRSISSQSHSSHSLQPNSSPSFPPHSIGVITHSNEEKEEGGVADALPANNSFRSRHDSLASPSSNQVTPTPPPSSISSGNQNTPGSRSSLFITLSNYSDPPVHNHPQITSNHSHPIHLSTGNSKGINSPPLHAHNLLVRKSSGQTVTHTSNLSINSILTPVNSDGPNNDLSNGSICSPPHQAVTQTLSINPVVSSNINVLSSQSSVNPSLLPPRSSPPSTPVSLIRPTERTASPIFAKRVISSLHSPEKETGRQQTANEEKNKLISIGETKSTAHTVISPSSSYPQTTPFQFNTNSSDTKAQIYATHTQPLSPPQPAPLTFAGSETELSVLKNAANSNQKALNSSNPPVLNVMRRKFVRPASTTPNNAETNGVRVLVAEDSLPNLKLLLVLLRKMGAIAEGVENGLLAVKKFEEWEKDKTKPYPFDIILMDGNMPIMDGIEATRRLRAMGLTIPIVAVTGNALEEDTSAFIRAGVDAVLTKPIAQKELQKVLASSGVATKSLSKVATVATTDTSELS